MGDNDRKRRPTVERVDVDRAVKAQREDSGERRSAEAEERRAIEAKARRAQEQQARLMKELQADQERLEAEKAELETEREGLRSELASAAEENLNLDNRVKRSSLLNTIITTAIAAVTALGSVGFWAYNRIQTQAQAEAVEGERRRRVAAELKSADESIENLRGDLGALKNDLDAHKKEQAKVNTVQLLRGSRVETMLELSLRKQGKKPPEKTPEQTTAECEAGLIEADSPLCAEVGLP